MQAATVIAVTPKTHNGGQQQRRQRIYRTLRVEPLSCIRGEQRFGIDADWGTSHWLRVYREPLRINNRSLSGKAPCIWRSGFDSRRNPSVKPLDIYNHSYRRCRLIPTKKQCVMVKTMPTGLGFTFKAEPPRT
jgi:hypothetical protein